MLGEHGVSGDAVCDTRHHGGADQAVYVYLMADYEYWSRQYQREFTPGEFGENITITGDPDYEWKIGDRLQFDEVHIEVTAPESLVGCSRPPWESNIFLLHSRKQIAVVFTRES